MKRRESHAGAGLQAHLRASVAVDYIYSVSFDSRNLLQDHCVQRWYSFGVVEFLRTAFWRIVLLYSPSLLIRPIHVRDLHVTVAH